MRNWWEPSYGEDEMEDPIAKRDREAMLADMEADEAAYNLKYGMVSAISAERSKRAKAAAAANAPPPTTTQ